jgi:CRP-like cAMP-binding protein
MSAPDRSGLSRSELEAVLGNVAIFELLRPDEIGRIARRCEVVSLARGQRHGDPASGPRLVVVVRGEVEIEVSERGGTLRAHMAPGDRFGTASLVTGEVRPFTVVARRQAAIAVLDRAAFAAVLAEFPAVAIVLARELAKEVAVRDDFLRQLLELHHARLPDSELRAAIRERESAQHRRGARVTRSSTRGLFHRLVVERGAEPPFWMLVGFLLSLGGARLVVHLILKYHLESRLFALVPGHDPNPMHVHHFNYGLILVASAGLAALRPLGRRALRALALVFGLGAGLVFDEFALFWRLDPEYSQELSVIAAGVAAGILLQLVYFRAFWTAVARRAWLGLRGTR